MPRKVDHEQRRARIADAVCRLVARDGLESVSLRQVASEAGVSMGQVQHYFATKDEMLAYSFNNLSARVEQRLQNAMAGTGEQPTSSRSLLRVLLQAMVPLDPTTRSEAPLWVAYAARAAVRPELAEALRSNDLVVFVAGIVREAQASGHAARDLDADIEAASILALADGLMIRVLIDPDFAADAEAALDYHLDRIFPPSLQGAEP